MTPGGATATVTTVAGTSGTVITALLTNSSPLLILGGLLGIALLVVSVVILTAARSKDAVRAARAAAVLDKLLTIGTRSRGGPPEDGPSGGGPLPAPLA